MHRFRIAIRIALIGLLVFVFVVVWIAASICWPVGDGDMREVAAAMIRFYNQPHPHGIWIKDLPASLTERGRQYYRFDPSQNYRFGPSCDVQPGYMSVEYYYRRFGIEYEPRFTLMRRNTNDPTWTLEPGIMFWNPWKHEHYYLRERSITITNTP